MNEIIKELEQAIEDERDELERMGLLSLEQNKKIAEDADMLSKSKKVDKMLWILHLLENIRQGQ